MRLIQYIDKTGEPRVGRIENTQVRQLANVASMYELAVRAIE